MFSECWWSQIWNQEKQRLGLVEIIDLMISSRHFGSFLHISLSKRIFNFRVSKAEVDGRTSGHQCVFISTTMFKIATFPLYLSTCRPWPEFPALSSSVGSSSSPPAVVWSVPSRRLGLSSSAMYWRTILGLQECKESHSSLKFIEFFQIQHGHMANKNSAHQRHHGGFKFNLPILLTFWVNKVLSELRPF